MTAPKPCPFCGSVETDTTCVTVSEVWALGAIVCAREECAAHGSWCDSEVDAITAWNRAPRPPSPADMARERSRRVRDRRRLRQLRRR